MSTLLKPCKFQALCASFFKTWLTTVGMAKETRSLRVWEMEMLPRLPHRIREWYCIFTYMYHKNQPNIGKYTMHGSYGADAGVNGPSTVSVVSDVARETSARFYVMVMLLMEGILHHLGCIKPCFCNGIFTISTGAGFQPSTVLISKNPKLKPLS